MKRTTSLILTLVTSAVVACAAPFSAMTADSTRVELHFFSPTAVRVVKVPAGAPTPDISDAITARPDDAVAYKTRQSAGRASVSTSGMRVDVDLRRGTVSFADASGRRLLAEHAPATFGTCTELGRPARTAAQSFDVTPAEAIYGLGNYANGQLNQRGTSHTLMPGNIEDGIPVVYSTRGYAMYWDSFAPTEWTEQGGVMSFDSAPADAVDYYFVAPDGTRDGAVAGLRLLSGKVPMMPLWTYGFWQSRERYKSQDEITGVVRRYRDLGVPLDAIIQDWQYWGNNYLWNAMEFMNPEFPQPQSMVDSIHAMNAHAIISIWSSFGPMTKPYAQLDSAGLLFNIATWPESGISHQWPPRKDYPSGVRVYNTYNPKARDIYWQNLSRLHDLGIDGWWMDSTEPDHFDGNMDFDTGRGSFRRVRGAYPLLTVGGVHDHQTAVDTTKRVFILTRSGWFGQQRYGCNVWTGDVASTWDMLRKQIPAHLNFTMTGNPNVNSDLGGFFCNHYAANGQTATANPRFRELTVRWMQLGALTPMMRSHGADAPREIYQFGRAGEPVYDAILQAIKLRYALMPYVYSTAWEVTDADGSFMRPLSLDFPADKRVRDMASEYMFGPSLLVAPVLQALYTPESTVAIDENSGWDRNAQATDAGAAEAVDFTAARTAKVYFPAGTAWYDFFTGERHAGGREEEVAVTLSTIPLYARAGSIVPLGPDVQYTGEKPWDELTIKVFPGADGSFTLYEDAGDGFGYTRGERTTIPFDYKRGTLTIGERVGAYPGMLQARKFNIVNGATGATTSVDYDGTAKSVKI